MTANGYGIVFWDGEDVLKLVMMIVQKQITELTHFKNDKFWGLVTGCQGGNRARGAALHAPCPLGPWTPWWLCHSPYTMKCALHGLSLVVCHGPVLLQCPEKTKRKKKDKFYRCKLHLNGNIILKKDRFHKFFKILLSFH